MNVSSVKSTSTSTPTLYKPNNWKCTLILWTLNKRKIFPTITHDGCQYAWALAEWFTHFQLWNHCFCLRPNHQIWSNFFFFENEIKSNILVAHSVHYEYFPITHSRKWKGKLAKTGHGPHSSKIVVLFYVLFVLYHSMYCLCVNVYCTTATRWQPNCS